MVTATFSKFSDDGSKIKWGGNYCCEADRDDESIYRSQREESISCYC